MDNICSTWDTPFTNSSFPSVGMVLEPDGVGTAILVVAPEGLAKYPMYLVRFKRVFAVTCGEEAGFVLALGQEHCPPGATAFIWEASPHAAAYAETAFGYGQNVRHYVVFGGDNIASVVAGEPPTIEAVTGPRELVISYAI